MNSSTFKLIWIVVALTVVFGLLALNSPDAAVASTVVVFFSLIAVVIFRQFSKDKNFVTKVFFIALAARLAFGIFVHYFMQVL